MTDIEDQIKEYIETLRTSDRTTLLAEIIRLRSMSQSISDERTKIAEELLLIYYSYRPTDEPWFEYIQSLKNNNE